MMGEDQIKTALAWTAENRKAALATVISTVGSSPSPVGNQVVVDEHGAFQGSVSGGCIESTIITEAQYSIRENKPKLLSIGIENIADWDTVPACGGNVEIFVENVASSRRILERLMTLRKAHQKVCLVTHLGTGDKQLLRAKAVEDAPDQPPQLKAAVTRVLETGHSALIYVNDHAYFLHGFVPPPQLIIVGAVHIAQPLSVIARLIGYQVTIIDPRTAFATAQRFPDTQLVQQPAEKALEEIPLHENTALVVLSHLPRLDDPALIYALRSDVFYIGALGSQKTHSERLNRLRGYGFSEEQLQRIHGPVGLKIGGTTPAEIAVSIIAEVTQRRNKSVGYSSICFK